MDGGGEQKKTSRRKVLGAIGAVGAGVAGFGLGALKGSVQLRGLPDTTSQIILPDVHMVEVENVSEKVSMQKGASEKLKEATFIKFDQTTGRVRFINPDGSMENEINPREDIINVLVKIPNPSSMQFTYFYPNGGEMLTIIHEFVGGYISFHNTWENPAQDDKAIPPSRK